MESIIKTYKYKIKANSKLESVFDGWIGSCRTVYNLSLDVRSTAWRMRRANVSKYDLIRQLPELKRGFPWLLDTPSQALQNAVERMDLAYKRFFTGSGFPKWAKKGVYASVTLKQGVRLDMEGNRIFLPKAGWVRYFNSRNIPGLKKIRTVTIKKQVDGYHMSLCVEQDNPCTGQEPLYDNQVVGVDLGVASLATLSDGRAYQNHAALKKWLRRLRVEQRALARKKKGSRARAKCKGRIAKLHLKVANIRKDQHNKATTDIVKGYGGMVIEDLRLLNMTKSAKGSLEDPGTNVRAKSGLNRSLVDASLGSFSDMLEYKAKWYGRSFEKVDPSYTSQTCNVCGHRDPSNRKTQASFECSGCGHRENADINAAKNILARARASTRERRAVA